MHGYTCKLGTCIGVYTYNKTIEGVCYPCTMHALNVHQHYTCECGNITSSRDVYSVSGDHLSNLQLNQPQDAVYVNSTCTLVILHGVTLRLRDTVWGVFRAPNATT